MSLAPCAEGALECGGLTPPWPAWPQSTKAASSLSLGRLGPQNPEAASSRRLGELALKSQGGVKPPPSRRPYARSGLWGSQGGVKPPHSKALRAFAGW